MTTDTAPAPEAAEAGHTDACNCNHEAEAREEGKHVIAQLIARSRYEAWDSHAKTIPWDEFTTVDPQTAVGIYIEDGLRDAEAVLPFVEALLDAATISGAHMAAQQLANSRLEPGDANEGGVSDDAQEVFNLCVDTLESYVESLTADYLQANAAAGAAIAAAEAGQ